MKGRGALKLHLISRHNLRLNNTCATALYSLCPEAQAVNDEPILFPEFMSKIASKILIVDDEEDILLAGKLLLKQHFAVVSTTSDPYQIPSLLREHSFDVVLLDMNYSTGATSSKEGFHWLK